MDSNVSDKVKDLLKARVDAAHTELEGRWKVWLKGYGTLGGSSREVLEAERELSEKKGDQIAPLVGHFERMKRVQELAQQRFNQGRWSKEDLASAKYHRYQAEIWLERAKAK
jgi:hypothetical protein